MKAFVALLAILATISLACGDSSKGRAKITLDRGKGANKAVEIKGFIVDKKNNISCLNIDEIFKDVTTKKEITKDLVRGYISDIRLLDQNSTTDDPQALNNDYAQQQLILAVSKDPTSQFYDFDTADKFGRLLQIKSISQSNCNKVEITYADNTRVDYSIDKKSVTRAHLYLKGTTSGDLQFDRLSNNRLSLARFFAAEKEKAVSLDCKKPDDKASNLLYRVEQTFEWAYGNSKIWLATSMVKNMKALTKSTMEFEGLGREKGKKRNDSHLKLTGDEYEKFFKDLQQIEKPACK